MLDTGMTFHKFLMILLASFWAVFSLAGRAPADVVPFNGSEVAANIALVEVTDAGVLVELEIFIEDVPIFIDIVPTEWISDEKQSQTEYEERIARFGREVLSIRDQTGQALPVKVELIEPRMRVDRASPLAGQADPLTGRVVPSPPADPRVVYAELFYAFEGDKPDTLTFAPPLRDGAPTAVIGMQVSDRQVPVTEFRFLSTPVTLRLDWDDPWNSEFTLSTMNRNARDGTMTFLYVEPREVRQEVLIRLRELAAYIGHNFELGADLAADDQSKIIAAATDFFLQRSAIEMDGQAVSASTSRGSILSLNAQGFQVSENAEPVFSNAAFVGVILSYPIVDLPEKIDVDWSLFDEDIVRVPVVMTDNAGPFFSAVTPDSPSYEWVNHLLTYENPSVSGVAMDAPVPEKAQIAFLSLGGLLAVAAVFAFVRRRAFWTKALGVSATAVLLLGLTLRSGALDHVLTGVPETPVASAIFGQVVDNLNVTALEVTKEARAEVLASFSTDRSQSAVAAEFERGLAIRVPGGTLARPSGVRDLSVENVSPLENGPGFRVLANWTTLASAKHMGHDHNRAVRYRALAEIVPEDGFWRIDGLTVLEAKLPNS